MDRKMEDFSYGRCFSIIYRHGKVMSDKFIRKFKMSGLQHYYLMEICKNPGISQETLARHHGIDRGAMSKAIKRMANMGYLRREQNPEDKRAYRLFPTEKSEEIWNECHMQIREMERKMAEGMTEEEVALFKKLLVKVTDNMEKMMKEGKDI